MPDGALTGGALGLKIRDRRGRLGLTQSQLAQRLGISPSYLNLIERNKRGIPARLLPELARELGVERSWLDGEAERRLTAELRELSADPVLRDVDLRAEDPADLVARSPGWAQAVVTLYRAYLSRNQAVGALLDRLNQDPYLSDAVHTMLTKITTIRSTAEILDTVDDLAPAERRRFQGMLAQESANLSGIAEGIAQFFDTADTEPAAMTPAEEVDDFIVANNYHFPAVEAGVEQLRRRLQSDRELSGAPGDAVMRDYLDRVLGVRVRFVAEEEVAPERLWNQIAYDAAAGTLSILENAAAARTRFQMARLICRLSLRDASGALIESSEQLRSAEARERAAGALASYAAACLLMPYDAFREDAEAARYDIEYLARKYLASYEQVCHRLVSLRRPDAQGVPFAFMRSDPAGFITKRMPLPRLPLPRYGNACPLWGIYHAFQTPGTIQRQIAVFPNGERFLFIARAQGKGESRFGAPRHLVSVMLACDIRHADRTIYADGLDLSSDTLAVPVGPTCRLCARRACSYREEPAILDTAEAAPA
jgi:predicted transcriptional regulator/transcriptional regulator with XRE-family HTH domain